ncbi:MAG: amidohydrolase family protein [Planctomycetes bacterium]|nr:amidohydrolase family protein [Planctomycetota bacterium]
MRVRSVPAAAFLAAAVLAGAVAAQTPPHNGPRPVDPGWYALTGARLVVAAANEAEGFHLVLRGGRIAAIARGAPPAGATVVDCSGLWIYPGLIDPFVPTDVPALAADATDQHWHPMIQPQRNALDGALVPAAERAALRRLGFTTVGCAPSGGILKGTSCVVQLDEPTPTEPVRVLRRAAAQVASLQTRRGGHPDSEMGAIALLRQTLADAIWYQRCQATPGVTARPSAALQALAAEPRLPLWFDVQDELQALRAVRVGREFERSVVLVGNGMEFRRLAALAAARVPIVVPLHLPDAPDVTTAAAAERVSLRQLQSWEQAPTNSRRLLDAGVEIAWTTARLRDRKDFFARVRDAMRCGVTADDALLALTTRPAGLLGIGDQAGSIERGKLANLVVATGPLFDEGTEIRDVWVGGVRHVVTPPKDRGLDGTWQWTAGWPGAAGAAALLSIAGDRIGCKVGTDALEVTAVEREPDAVAFRLAGAALGDDAAHWLRLHREGEELAGTRMAPDGSSHAVRAGRQPAAPDEPGRKRGDRAERTPPVPARGPLPTPLGGYGFVEPPARRDFVVFGATLWTGEAAGIVPRGAVLVRNGRIAFVGPIEALPTLPGGADDLVVVDGTGKHLTPGLIDCHSHTGISRGVNESGEAVTAEVRIEDVIDPDDVNWYRQLAGGVTTVNQLHGSANAIGGQSCTTKVRYGVLHPDEMRLQGAPPGIKWALGENPRRANSSGTNTRYPNTRMGVEALLRDRLAAAAAYRREHAAYETLSPAERARRLPPRRDLELEALAEVLAGSRRIHCHSYRQDEIFMLCNLALEHGIRIGTFQHVLEGYKVADAIAAAAVGASSFSDWWAYKFEVYDAIPDNGALLHAAGVCVSFNSDSNEHARRLNTEAGKAVKYGGVPPAEALCFVTRNPAIQLGIADRTGTLAVGKDADLALWSDDPLGYAARCEATWVDGRLLFSLANDRALREGIAAERQRLLQLAAAAPKGRTAREGDPKDAYWAAEDQRQDYCCRDCEGGR